MRLLEPGPLVGLTILESRRIQQREYVRVPLSTEAWGFCDKPGAPVEEIAPFRLQVQDLSAGGLRGRTGGSLTPGDEITIDLPLPDALPPQTPQPLLLRGRVVALHDLPEPLNLRARVVRRVEMSLPDDALACEIGVAFLDVPKEARERIIRFALSVQRDRRRRGML
jgi:c-di-GMP-binding flagellar brake protein YcgR